MKLKCLLLFLAKWVGLFAFSRRFTTNKLRILGYHGIKTTETRFGNFLFMSGEKFATRMALLSKWGYPVIALDDAWPPTVRSWPAGATVITIDDGWHSTFQHMLPTLLKHGFPATIYLTTYYCINQLPVAGVALSYAFSRMSLNTRLDIPELGFGPYVLESENDKNRAADAAKEILREIDEEPDRQEFVRKIYQAADLDFESILEQRHFHLMNREEVREAAGSRIRFEMHTHRHTISNNGVMTLCDELRKNSELIEELTGRSPRHFCYPDGVMVREAESILSQFRVASATTTTMGIVSREDPSYALPRIMDGEDVTDIEFEAEISGFMSILRGLLFFHGQRQPS